MRGVLTAFLSVLALLLAGCAASETPWVRGRIEPGLPRRAEAFPADAAFFVEKTEARVQAAFEAALRARGFAVAQTAEESDVLVRVEVASWTYNDAGFGGRGARDDMELAVSLVDRRRSRILARANISLRSDFRIIGKYVDGL